MLTFLIKVPGQVPYHGLFSSNLAARQDAEARFPDSPPATVMNITFCTGHAEFLRCNKKRRFWPVAAVRKGGQD